MPYKIQIPRTTSKRFKCTLELEITQSSSINKWAQISKLETVIFEIFISSKGFFQATFEISLSQRECREGTVDLELLFHDYPIYYPSIHENKLKSFSALPSSSSHSETLTKAILTPISYEDSRKIAALNAALSSSPPHAFSSPQICSQLQQVILDAIDTGKPLSVIRLGDGEGRLLGFPHIFDINEIVSECLNYQFGKKCLKALAKKYPYQPTISGAFYLKNLLEESIKTADIVCAPSIIRFNDPICEKLFNPRVAAAYANLYTRVFAARTFVPDTFIFLRLHKLALIEPILKASEFITVISHTSASKQLKETYGIENIDHIQIPGHSTFMRTSKPHYPFLYKKIQRKINVKSKKHLFLVSAGYLGKHYCKVAKSKGGIAIDIGSLFDSWIGIGRRDAIAREGFRLKTLSKEA